MKRIIVLLVALTVISGAAFGQWSGGGWLLGDVFQMGNIRSTPGFNYPVASERGYGGQHTAYTRGVNTLFVNPAELGFIKSEFSLISLDLYLLNVENLLKAAGSIPGGIDSLAGGGAGDMISSLLGTMNSLLVHGKMPLGFELRGPLNIAYAGNGWGVGIFERIWTDKLGLYGSYFAANLYVDAIAIGGFSIPIIDTDLIKFAAGVNVKGFGRTSLNFNKQLTSLMGSLSGGEMDIGAIVGAENLTLPLLVGAGVDAGVSLHINFLGDIAVGLVAQDLFTAGKQIMGLGQFAGDFLGDTLTIPEWDAESDAGSAWYVAPTVVNFGVAWKPITNGFFSLAVFADYTDVVSGLQYAFTGVLPSSTSRHPLLNLSAGAEIGLLSFLKVRAGFADLLPSVGIGLDLFIAEIDVSVYGKELGINPGENPVIAVDAAVRVAF